MIEFYALQLTRGAYFKATYIRDIYDELPGEPNVSTTTNVQHAMRFRVVNGILEPHLFHFAAPLHERPIIVGDVAYTSVEDLVRAGVASVKRCRVAESEETIPEPGGYTIQRTTKVSIEDYNLGG